MTSRASFLREVKFISDDDCGMYRIGEIDQMPDDDVETYVQRFGEYGYQQVLEFAARLMVAAKTSLRAHYAREQSGSCVAQQDTSLDKPK